MILSDREIKSAIARKALKITPEPSPEAWSSTAVDLRLSRELVLWTGKTIGGTVTTICPSSADYNFNEVREHFGQKINIAFDGYVFEPRTFLLSWTIEKIRLPFRSRLAARVEGKSSLARLGIGVHVTAPTIHAGFGDKKGDEAYDGSPLQLEMWNCGPLRVQLVEGMPICQLIFEVVDGTPEKGYDGRFSIQGPSVSS